MNTGVKATRLEARFLLKWALVLICGAALQDAMWGQSAAKSPAPSGSSSQDGTGALGFSIESEMLTYRALESNSEAVGCDVAAYIRGGSASFANPPAGQVCTISGGADNKAGIVIFSFDQTGFNDFRMWRADMLAMSELRARALAFCPATPSTASQPIQVTPKGAAASILGATPAAGALSLVQAGLGLVSSQTSTSSVTGTIQDQAFMDGVARELRSLAVTVIMPAAYLPDVLAPIDPARSPFLESLDKLYTARRCLLGKAADNNPATAQAIAQLVADIDSYLAAVSGSPAVKSAPAAAPGGSAPAKTGADNGGTQGAENSAAAPAGSQSHLMAVLSADSMAQKLGVDPQTGLMPANGGPQHILLLKALESGGSIEKHSNILGTKIRYSGGSVGTYALFSMDGELECSGDVYEYGGSLSSKDFQQGLRGWVPNPGKQYIFQRVTCQTEAH